MKRISLPEIGIGKKLYTSNEIYDGMYEYKDEYFVMGDSVERNSSFSFSQIGQMPLPNGDYAKYYNIATGLFMSKLAMSDPTMESKIVDLYTYMTQDSYYMSDIASREGSLPANRYQAEDYEFYLNTSLEDYIDMINDGISSIRFYNLYTLYDAMGLPLQDFVNGSTPEEVVESIMLNLSNSGN